MKNFLKFIKEEADIKDIQGIPDDFIPKSKKYASETLGVRPDDPGQMRQLGPELMGLLGRAKDIMSKTDSGRKLNQIEKIERLNSLSELAEKIVQHKYKDLIEIFEQTAGRRIIFDMQILPEGKDVIDEVPRLREKPAFPEKTISSETPKDIKSSVSKQKIIDMYGQGAGFEVEEIMNSYPGIDQELEEIFGYAAPEFKRISSQTMRVGNKLDWAWPGDDKARMMKNQPAGMAGANDVDWNRNKKEVWITVRALDFTMLLHEASKAVARLGPRAVSNTGDVQREQDIKKYTSSFKDETEDFRYGTPARLMLTQFINRCIQDSPKMIEDENMNEFVFIELSRHPKNGGEYSDDLFLWIVKEIFSCFDLQGGRFVLNETRYKDSSAKNQIDGIIDHITREYPDKGDVATAGPADEEEDDISQLKQKTAQKETDPSTWSQSRLNDEIDQALDRADFDRVKELSKYLKESRVYLQELERINEKVELISKFKKRG
jgi:hypothetical protein